MKLKIGMIVCYKPTSTEMGYMKERHSVCNIKEELPAVVVAIDEDTEVVNLKVLLDGQGDIWATAVVYGEGVGEWEFYPSEEDDLIQDYVDMMNRYNDAKIELQELIDSIFTNKESETSNAIV